MAAAFFVSNARNKGTEMSEKLKQLQDKRLELAAALKAHADKLKPDATAEETGEWKSAWDKLNADYDSTKAVLDAELRRIDEAKAISDRINAIDSELSRGPHKLVGRDGGSVTDGPRHDIFGGLNGIQERARNQFMAMHGWMLNHTPGNAGKVTEQHRQAAASLGLNLNDSEFVLQLAPLAEFNRLQSAYVQAGSDKAKNILNAMTEGSGPGGGYLVGSTFLRSMEQAILNFSGVLQVADVLRTDAGEELIWPMVDDTGNSGSLVGESADAGSASNPTFSRLRLQAFTVTSGQLNVSRSLIADSSIGIEPMIGELLGTRIGRKVNTLFTTGTGGGLEPLGIVTASAAGVTAASATALAFDELIDLAHSVDPGYRVGPRVGYMMHDSILKAVRKLKDGNGQYLWSRGTDAREPDRINGYPYWINQAMASSMSSGNKTMLFGDFSKHKVRMVGSIRLQRLVERRAEYDEDAFIAYMRVDCGLLNAGTNPVKRITH